MEERGAVGGAAYISKLPDGGGGLGLPVVGAVPHAQIGLPLGDLGTKLSHRVEADLLLRRVFKVLEWGRGLTHTHRQSYLCHLDPRFRDESTEIALSALIPALHLDPTPGAWVPWPLSFIRLLSLWSDVKSLARKDWVGVCGDHIRGGGALLGQGGPGLPFQESTGDQSSSLSYCT